MNLRLLSLTFAPFAFGTSAFVFVGLIGPMAVDLGVGVPAVGQLQTVFALACGIGGPILARLLSGFDRKLILIGVMMSLAVMNVASALAPGFSSITAIRLLGGFFAALAIPLSSIIAVNMVPEEKRASAIATVLAGYTFAFLFGMPMGSFLGDHYGWRAAFWFAGGIGTLAAIIIALTAPKNVAVPDMAGVNFRSALTPENRVLVMITLLGFFATFVTVAYIGPVITRTTGLEGSAIGGVQIAIGLGSIVGLPAGAALGRLPVRRALFILLWAILVSQGVFTVGMLFDFGALALPLLVVCMIISSASLFATLPVIQSRLAVTAGAAATIAFALNSSMSYFGQALGASLGGTVTASFGLPWVGASGAIVAALCLVFVGRLPRAA